MVDWALDDERERARAGARCSGVELLTRVCFRHFGGDLTTAAASDLMRCVREVEQTKGKVYPILLKLDFPREEMATMRYRGGRMLVR